MPTYTHLVQWLEHQAYTLGVGGSNPPVSTILEYQSGLMAQSAKLMIREFKSHLQVKQVIQGLSLGRTTILFHSVMVTHFILVEVFKVRILVE